MGGKLSYLKVNTKTLGAQQDLDKLIENGIYMSSNTSYLINVPVNVNKSAMAILIVLGTSFLIGQILICGNTMFTRESLKDKFSAWQQI